MCEDRTLYGPTEGVREEVACRDRYSAPKKESKIKRYGFNQLTKCLSKIKRQEDKDQKAKNEN